jgi:quercetin dioxygenase-like cupin family protein
MGTVRVVDEKTIEWHGFTQDQIDAVRARGINVSPEELAGTSRSHHAGSETEPEMFEVRFPPNTVVHPHAHLVDEIIYVVAGQLIVGNRVLEPGSSVFIAGRTLYTFRAGPEGVHFLNFRPRAGGNYLSKGELLAQRGSNSASVSSS